MNKHFVMLLVGTGIFVVMFLWETTPFHSSGVEEVIRHASRVGFLYAAFLVVLFGHHCLIGKDQQTKE